MPYSSNFAPFVMVMMMVSVLFVVMLVLFVVMAHALLRDDDVRALLFFLFGGWFLYPANPSCRGSHAFEVEQVCMDNLL